MTVDNEAKDAKKIRLVEEEGPGVMKCCNLQIRVLRWVCRVEGSSPCITKDQLCEATWDALNKVPTLAYQFRFGSGALFKIKRFVAVDLL
ncbi:hypothetical protein TNCV_2377041 [Trichonephila clavipes]|nr:hypothetical protein TNCV_2377041 [Trichonephila clavipes]